MERPGSSRSDREDVGGRDACVAHQELRVSVVEADSGDDPFDDGRGADRVALGVGRVDADRVGSVRQWVAGIVEPRPRLLVTARGQVGALARVDDAAGSVGHGDLDVGRVAVEDKAERLDVAIADIDLIAACGDVLADETRELGIGCAELCQLEFFEALVGDHLLLERTERGELGDELVVLDRTVRILMLELRHEQLEEVLSSHALGGFGELTASDRTGGKGIARRCADFHGVLRIGGEFNVCASGGRVVALRDLVDE